MKFTSPKQLKDWIKNKVANEGIPSNYQKYSDFRGSP